MWHSNVGHATSNWWASRTSRSPSSPTPPDTPSNLQDVHSSHFIYLHLLVMVFSYHYWRPWTCFGAEMTLYPRSLRWSRGVREMSELPLLSRYMYGPPDTGLPGSGLLSGGVGERPIPQLWSILIKSRSRRGPTELKMWELFLGL